MRTVVVTREFDENGNCVRETRCEYDYDPQPTVVPEPYVRPSTYPYAPYVWYSGGTSSGGAGGVCSSAIN